jgi:LTXXQ motif family protein
MIEDRFAERLTIELGLSEDQAGKVRAVLANWSSKRRSLQKEERTTRQQLTAEMRPGVAANQANVSRMVDQILDVRVAYVQTFKDELKDLSGILNPIQRAQYVLLRDRLNQRVQEIRNERKQEGDGLLRRRRLRP